MRTRLRNIDTSQRELSVGELRRQVRLGSEAIYRVCGWDERLAEVEVVRAPGLRAGHRIRLTLDAVVRMEPVEDPGGANPPRAG